MGGLCGLYWIGLVTMLDSYIVYEIVTGFSKERDLERKSRQRLLKQYVSTNEKRHDKVAPGFDDSLET